MKGHSHHGNRFIAALALAVAVCTPACVAGEVADEAEVESVAPPANHPAAVRDGTPAAEEPETPAAPAIEEEPAEAADPAVEEEAPGRREARAPAAAGDRSRRELRRSPGIFMPVQTDLDPPPHPW